MQAEAEAAVRTIVEASVRDNETNHLTGALIFTGTQFAQYLEGPAEQLNEMKARVLEDHRHADVRTLEEAQRTARTFPNWSMAYSGPSMLVKASLAGFLEHPGGLPDDSPVELITLMLAVTDPAGRAGFPLVMRI